MKQCLKKIDFSDDFTYIIDANGNKIKINDRRVVHIWPLNNNATPFIVSIFQKQGWRIRVGEQVNSEVLQSSKKLCSGRECLAFHVLTGMYYEDIKKQYNKDDILVYWGVEQEGPCQCGAWAEVWKVFSERLGITNAIYTVNLTLQNNFLGQGLNFGSKVLASLILGDLFDEAEYALKSLAVHKKEALKIFKEEIMKVVPNLHKGPIVLDRSLKEWSDNIRKIPLKASVEETPKILIFGGGVMNFIREPIAEYCYRQGVIPKIVDFSEFILFLFSECARRYGFKKGYDNLNQHLNLGSMFLSFLDFKQNKREIKNAVSSRITLELGNFLSRRFRNLLQTSGVIFDKHVSLISLLKDGQKFINPNIFHEADVPLGKYMKSIESGVFDGLVHIATFSCQPSINSQAAIRAISHQYDIPFVGLEMEGPWLLANHQRLLENVVVQARRLRIIKNNRLQERHTQQRVPKEVQHISKPKAVGNR